jgi:DNA-binding SARP family transcriptional activator
VIRLRTLGALDLESADGQQLSAILAQPKRVALLAYLALARPGGFQQRDTLLALFWPERDSEHARNSLSQSLHVLRRALGADTLMSRNGDAIGIDPQLLWCDAVAFNEALDSGRTSDAVELYRGDLLEGFHVAASPEFEQWLAAERARLGGRYANAIEAIATAEEAVGKFGDAVVLWRRRAARDPYSSRVALRLMSALAAAGDSAAAIQHARVHETLLREELNAAPDAEIAFYVKHAPLPCGVSTRRHLTMSTRRSRLVRMAGVKPLCQAGGVGPLRVAALRRSARD